MPRKPPGKKSFFTLTAYPSPPLKAVKAEKPHFFAPQGGYAPLFLQKSIAKTPFIRYNIIGRGYGSFAPRIPGAAPTLVHNEKLLKKRLDETVERFNVGEVTRTDVSQAQARYSQAKADRIASEGNLQASKAVYTRVIGEAPKDLSEPENLGDFIPASFQEALEYTKANNYSIRYARELLNSRVYDVAANTGALLPSVTLDGSATTSKSDSSGSAYGAYNRDTKVDEVQWGVNMNIPLYTAGETRAKIRQSKYQKWQAQELVLEAERQAVSDVTSAWELMTSNKAQIKSIKDQVKANEIALDGVQKEEALGNRTILDVLDAYQELLNSNVNEVKARRDYYVAAMQLLLSMGKLTAEDLRLNVDLYNPKKFYKETRDKWLSLSVD